MTEPADDPVELKAGDSLRFVASTLHCCERIDDYNTALLVRVRPDHQRARRYWGDRPIASSRRRYVTM